MLSGHLSLAGVPPMSRRAFAPRFILIAVTPIIASSRMALEDRSA